jgi:uncharacterized protein (TIGR02246 family)
MKTLSSAVLVVLALGAVSAHAEKPPTTDVTRLRQVNEAFARAVSAGDASKIGDLYTEDALLMPPNTGPLRGRAAVVAYFEGLLKAGKVSLEVRSGVAHSDGDLGYDGGQYAFELTPAQGSPTRDSGKYLVVLKRGADGKWRMAVDTWNSDLAVQ